MKPNALITIPEVIERFQNYYKTTTFGEWGSMHVVLSDLNVSDAHVKFCLDYAHKNNDHEGVELAGILLKMSKSQRLRISKLVK